MQYRSTLRRMAAALLCVAALAGCGAASSSSVPASSAASPASSAASSSAAGLSFAAPVQLAEGLVITDCGRYTGIYMEDGTDEGVADVQMIVVENTGSRTVQYATIALAGGEHTANFTLTTLPPGKKVVLLETSRLAAVPSETFSACSVEQLAFFPQEPALQADRLEIQPLDGALNITNISGADITGDVAVYYKNAAADLYYGGITYRATVQGGIKAGEIKQVMTNHFSLSGSEILFVTVADAAAQN